MKKIITFLSFFAVLIAQHNHDHNHPEWIRCATDELEQELQLTNPEFIAERDNYVEKAQRLLRENPQWRTNQASMNTIYLYSCCVSCSLSGFIRQFKQTANWI